MLREIVMWRTRTIQTVNPMQYGMREGHLE